MNIRLIVQLVTGEVLLALAACGSGVTVQGAGTSLPLSVTSGTSAASPPASQAQIVPTMSGNERLLACLHCAP